MKSGKVRDQRRHPRLRLPVGYAAVCVHRGDGELHGHAYDISLGGMRFELDAPLADGERVAIDLTLPGKSVRVIRATGRCVRRHDCDEVGPTRMGLSFDRLATTADRDALAHYLHAHRAAAAA